MPLLSITPSIRATGMVVLVLRGSLGRADTNAFANAVGQLLRTHRPSRMEVDLSGLVELEPGSADAMLAVLRTASREGTTIVLTYASSAVRQHLSAAGGDRFLS